MENNFLQSMKKMTTMTTTENGANTYNTSDSKLVDLFFMLSASRDKDNGLIFHLIEEAFNENDLLTLKMIFWCRDRERQGERTLFRNIIHYLALSGTIKYHEFIRTNIKNIPVFGRWDDLFVLLDTPLESNMIKFIKNQLIRDLKSDNPSLLAKWMPSENTSSLKTRALCTKIRKKFGWSRKYYTDRITLLRKKIDIVENKLREKNYSEIDYSKLPSMAMFKYKSAFKRNDEERYNEYLKEVSESKQKMNTSTLKPIDLVRRALTKNDGEEDYLNIAWEQLPDYFNGATVNGIAVVDVSGSMMYPNSTPLYTAISLGLYLADKTTGPFSGNVITFSDNPELVEVKGENFIEKVCNIKNMNWGYNTNIEAVFDLIIEASVCNNLKQEEIPERIFIISDMEFDISLSSPYTGASKPKNVLFEDIRYKFEVNGYKMPLIVFWNVASHDDNVPMKMTEEGVQLVSGSNPSLFKAVLEGKFLTPYDLMLSVLNDKRYDVIVK